MKRAAKWMENLFGGLLKVKKTEKNLNFCLL